MGKFRYSLNSVTIKTTPVLEKVKIAAEVGYEGIELWHDELDQLKISGGSLDDVRKALDDTGLAVPSTIMLKGWCVPDEAAYRQGVEECKRRLGQAAALGASHSIAGPPLGKVDYELAAQRYGELVDLGLSMGVKPAMEYLGFAEEVNSIADALRIVEGSGHADGTVVLDPFHDFRGGAGCEDIAKLKSSQIAVCHFDDAPADPPASEQEDPDRVMPGDGVIDLKRFVTLLGEAGYDRWLSLELFRPDLWKRDPREVARIGLEKMRSVCESS